MIEISTFRLLDDADEAAFSRADARAQTEFFYGRRGIVRRTTARGDGGEWAVVTLWETEADAEEARRASEADPAAREMMAFVDGSTWRADRYATLD